MDRLWIDDFALHDFGHSEFRKIMKSKALNKWDQFWVAVSLRWFIASRRHACFAERNAIQLRNAHACGLRFNELTKRVVRPSSYESR